MTLYDFFDIKNKNHLLAFKHCSKTGFWPNGFLPKNIKMPSLWQFELISKMACEYMKNMLGENDDNTGK